MDRCRAEAGLVQLHFSPRRCGRYESNMVVNVRTRFKIY